MTMQRLNVEDLLRCPLCRHKCDIILDWNPAGNHPVDVVRCDYCGCQLAAPKSGDNRDGNIEYLKKCWNNRVDHCQYCGAFVGSVEICPECGMTLEWN